MKSQVCEKAHLDVEDGHWLRLGSSKMLRKEESTLLYRGNEFLTPKQNIPNSKVRRPDGGKKKIHVDISTPFSSKGGPHSHRFPSSV